MFSSLGLKIDSNPFLDLALDYINICLFTVKIGIQLEKNQDSLSRKGKMDAWGATRDLFRNV